ncbi:MAG: 2-oxoacid:acceptor oxidoreductase [Sphaerochaetaceae bacterium]|nr:2-oxoacid:acceptor oxidoreductase [Candidatus Cloacimonadota bacterium]
MKRRNDATYVKDIDPYKRIFPYIMPTRNGSVVYHQFSVDLTKGVQFIKKLNKESPSDHQYRVFELFLAALIRTIAVRPHLNRFIMNYKYWQRNELSLNFVVKEDYTDEAPEHSAVIYFEPDMTFEEVAKTINETIVKSRKGTDGNDTDKAIEFFLKFPSWIIRFLAAILRYLDKKGVAPKALRDADGLHVSAFVANLGSINLLGSPHHHLYEWGTTSIFVTMGALKRRRIVDDEGTRTFADSMEIGVTLDERIADGFYFIKSIGVLQHYLNNPELLNQRLVLPEVKSKKKGKKRL